MSPTPLLDRLGDRSRPHFGVFTLTLLLIGCCCAMSYFLVMRGETKPGPRVGTSSVLSALPDRLLLDDRLFYGSAVLFVVAGVLWLGHVAIPWTSWLCALGYNLAVALYLENAQHVSHTGHLAGNLLLIHALWYHFYGRDMRQAFRDGRFWATPLYPRWTHLLCVWYIGVFYGMSGAYKWYCSGPDWPNGLSLQLWVDLWGDRDYSPLTGPVLANRHLATALQWVTILGETAGFLAIVSRTARPFVGLALIGLHIGAISVFRWGFYVNLAMLLLFFFPCDRWIAAWFKRGEPTDVGEPTGLSLPVSAGSAIAPP